MVRAILENRKFQTRRVIKPQPSGACKKTIYNPSAFEPDRGWYFEDGGKLKCPYGQLGDSLWVRETFYERFDGLDSCDFFAYVADGEKKTGRCAATAHEAVTQGFITKRPSIFMPKKYARLWLRIVNVRVERLQEITGQDILAEGIEWDKNYKMIGPCDGDEDGLIEHFGKLWNSLNAKRDYSWESNPWVWAIEFEKYDNQNTFDGNN